MLTRHEAEKAIKVGVARYGCKLVDCKFDEKDVTITVRGEVPLLQVGKEYDWANRSANELTVRVSRFCTTYANNKPYRFSWDNKLPV